jgi:hypothetical protein
MLPIHSLTSVYLLRPVIKEATRTTVAGAEFQEDSFPPVILSRFWMQITVRITKLFGYEI